MTTNRTNKPVFLIVVCVMALLVGVLPAMAWAPEGASGSEKPQIDPISSVSQSGGELQQAVVSAPQNNASAAPSTAAPAVVGTIITVDAGPVARPAAPIAAAPAVTAPQPAQAAPAAAPAVSTVSQQPQLPSTVAVPPSPSRDGEAEFTGKIASITGTLPNLTLIVGEHTVKTDSQTQISGTLDVSVTVEVKGTTQQDGSVLASRITVQDTGGVETEAEFRGPIVALPSDPNLNGQWVVGDVTVTVDLTTTVLPTRTAATLGAIAEVNAKRQLDGSLLAVKIQIEHADESEVEFRGPIVALPADPNLNGNWVVGNYSVTVNMTTTVVPSRTAAMVGAIAEVNALQQADGSLVAMKIKIENEHEFENEVEFKGTISNLTGTDPYTMTVAGHTVKTDALTEISGTLANGAFVEVKGTLQPDGTVLANQIKIEDQAQPVEVEFTAHITGALPSDLIGAWTFDNGKTVTVTTSTLIDQSHGAVAVGTLVEVKTLKQPDSSLVAVRIKVEDQ
jgi:hypothetical protein